MEKISIIVPCCNVESYVRECLESIKAQTYTQLEVICIDDGSKDQTGAIIDEFVAADPRFKAIHKPNSGYGDSMNRGLDCCTGDYVGIIESDDWIEPDMFETLITAAQKHDLDLVRCCWYEGPTGTERINDQYWVEKNSVYRPMEKEGVFLQQPSIWAALYRRDLLEEGRKVRFLPTPGASYQDTSFAFKAYTKSKRFMMLDKPLHHYRINPNSSVSSAGKVYCIFDEWEEMIRWVSGEPALRQEMAAATLLPKIWEGGLKWNYERLSKASLKLLSLRRASQCIRTAAAQGVFSADKLGTKNNTETVRQVMASPLDYHRLRNSERLGIVDSHKGADKGVTPGPGKNDLISVVVTCYNTSKYIYSALTSITRQSYKNIEIICVDDCSTDDTELQVRHLMRKDKRIKWMCTGKNSGLSASRNLGLTACQGKYVMFVDGDDCLLPGAIARLYAAMDADDDVTAGGAEVYYEGGAAQYGALFESDKLYYTITKEAKINARDDIDSAVNLHVCAWGKLWKRSVINDNNLQFPEGLLYEDACFYWKYLLVAPKVHTVKEPVYLYQRHAQGSIMSSTFEKKKGMSIQHIFILDNFYQFAREKKLEKQAKPILSTRYEPYFWLAFNNAPKSDYEDIFQNMKRILKEQGADTSESPILDYLAHYDDFSKSDIFIKAFDGTPVGGVETSPDSYRIRKKLKKYRKLTKLFALLSSILLIALIVTIILL